MGISSMGILSLGLLGPGGAQASATAAAVLALWRNIAKIPTAIQKTTKAEIVAPSITGRLLFFREVVAGVRKLPVLLLSVFLFAVGEGVSDVEHEVDVSRSALPSTLNFNLSLHARESGTAPVKRLYAKFSSCRSGNVPRNEGMGPDRPFCDKSII